MKRKEGKIENIFIKNAFLAFFVFVIFSSVITFVFSADDDLDLVISEIMYSPENGGSDWVEIYNSGNKDVDIGDWKIIDEYDLKINKNGDKYLNCHSISKNEFIIKSKKYIIISEGDDGDLKLKSLDLKGSDKDAVRISDDDCGSFIYEFEYNPKKDEEVEKGYSLELDDNKWRESYVLGGTPGKENSKKLDPVIYEKTIRIDELFPNPKESPERKYEFIELYNYGNEDIDLENWKIEDEGNNDFTLKNSVLESSKYVVFYNTVALNNNGDKIKIKNPNKEVVDEMEYEDAPEGQSFALNEKGKFQWTDIVTPGEKNQFPKPIKYSDKFVINEIMPNPIGSDNEEWFEIYYFGENEYLMSGWKIRDASGKEKELSASIFDSNNQYLVFNSEVSLNNSEGDELFLLNPRNEIVSEVRYPSAKEEGVSWSKKENEEYDWSNIATPGKQNEFPIVKKYSKKIKFNEVLSNPDGRDDDAEWVELFNENDFEVDLSGWKIKNSKDKIFEIEKGEIGARRLLVISIMKTSFSIKNSDEKLILLDPNEEKVDEIEIIEDASSGSSFNRGGDNVWSWSNHLTPGSKNKINHWPLIKVEIPDDFYEGIKIEFDASKTKDEDGDELKFRWEFGDEHKSYLEKTTHVYEDTGEYLVVLRVDDGSIYTYKEFQIEVEKYPEREIRIVKFIPNPVGKDSEKEAILLKNETKKKVNLKGWSVATGSSMSKLTNHSIYEDFIIKPGKTEELTRNDCKFSLLNKKGRVILRYPNGETADKVKYEKEKIEEGEILEIQNGELIWIKAGLEIKEELVSQEMSDNTEESVSVQGVSFEKQLLKAVLNEDLQCCETLRKIVIDNWKYQNRHWLALSKSILT